MKVTFKKTIQFSDKGQAKLAYAGESFAIHDDTAAGLIADGICEEFVAVEDFLDEPVVTPKKVQVSNKAKSGAPENK